MPKMLMVGIAVLCGVIGLTACGGGGGSSSGTSTEAEPAATAESAGSTQEESVGSTQEGAGEAENALIQVINPLPNVFVNSNNEGAENKAAELGLTNLQITQSGGDPAKEVANVNDAITKGAKAIIINPVSSEGVTPSIEAANEAGICTIVGYSELTNQPPGGKGVPKGSKAYIGWYEMEGGELVGNALAEAMGGKGGIVIIQGIGTGQAEQQREAGARKVWEEKYPGIKVLSVQPAEFDPAKARSVMQNFIQRYGDEIQGVLAIGDQMGSAAATVVAESELAGKVQIGGFGAEKEFVRAIENGEATVTVPFAPVEDWEKAVELAVECINGNTEPVRYSTKELPGVQKLKPYGYVVTKEDAHLWPPQW